MTPPTDKQLACMVAVVVGLALLAMWVIWPETAPGYLDLR